MDKTVQALQSRNFSVDQVQGSLMTQGDPQCAIFLAGTSDEIKITLVPRHKRVVAQDDGVWLEIWVCEK